MGANIKPNPTENCLLVTNKLGTEKVTKAKKLRYCKVIKPEFINDCKACGAYLNEKDYFHKL